MKKILIVSALLYLPHLASAKILSGPKIITAPSSVLDNKAVSATQQGFNEKQSVTLSHDLKVDKGVIPKGTVVDSHMIFLNVPVASKAIEKQAIWGFDGKILGVMSDRQGILEANSSAELGAPKTTYPANGFSARGLERQDQYRIDNNRLTVKMEANQPGDWIRVITKATTPKEAAINNEVTICHVPPGKHKHGQAQEITINRNALPAHLRHGDTIGSCDDRHKKDNDNRGSKGKKGSKGNKKGSKGKKGSKKH
jgi:hypothetical protein